MMKKYTSKLLVLALLTTLPQQAMEQEEKMSEILKGDKKFISLEAIKKLIDKNFDLDYKVKDGLGNYTRFLHLITISNVDWNEKIKILQYVINKGADVTKPNSDGETVLHCCTDNPKLLFYLIPMAKSQINNNNKNFNKWIEEKDSKGNTALVNSILKGFSYSLQTLVEYGANSTIFYENLKEMKPKLKKKIKKVDDNLKYLRRETGTFLLICLKKNDSVEMQFILCNKHSDIEEKIENLIKNKK